MPVISLHDQMMALVVGDESMALNEDFAGDPQVKLSPNRAAGLRVEVPHQVPQFEAVRRRRTGVRSFELRQGVEKIQ